jgi:hypothetical protein
MTSRDPLEQSTPTTTRGWDGQSAFTAHLDFRGKIMRR